MSPIFSLDPESFWAARLLDIGLDTRWETPTPDNSPIQRLVNAPSGAALDWNNLELFLWNELLPLQIASGEFRSSPDLPESLSDAQPGNFPAAGSKASAKEILAAILSSAVTTETDQVRWELPVSGELVPGSDETWRVKTEYPGRGAIRLEYGGHVESCRALQLRVPAGVTALQLTRNGLPEGFNLLEGRIVLPGPWKPGDEVALRFGLPFRICRADQNLLRDRPLERAYPGAPVVEGARLFHGLRWISPVPSKQQSENEPLQGGKSPDEASPAEGAAPGEFAIGVRKDGALLLQPDSSEERDPWMAPGDRWLTLGPGRTVAIPAALWGRLRGEKPIRAAVSWAFCPFETAFDKGA